MKPQILITLLLFTFSITYGQNLKWAKGIVSDPSSDGWGESIIYDNSGNSLITGTFYGPAVDFDPGPGTFSLSSMGGNNSNDLFILKLNPNGDFLWAKSIDINGYYSYSSTGANNSSIAVDSSGNIFITGNFMGNNVDFDPGPGIYNLSAPFDHNIFILKLDPNGNFLWAKSMGSNYSDLGNSIAVDNFGNSYTTGEFEQTVDFDPGLGTFILSVNGGSSGRSDIFILKLDPNGNFIWAKQIGGSDGDAGFSITIDNSGDILTTGSFYGNVDFNPGSGLNPLYADGLEDVFILKLDPNGNFIWAKNMGGSHVFNESSFSITTDNLRSVYTTGYFYGTADFDPGAGTFNLTSNGENDIFISKLDANGNFVWVKQIGGSTFDYGISITIDNSGNVNTAGSINGNVDLDPGAGTYNLGSGGAFISKLNVAGDFVSANLMNGSKIYSLAIDSFNNIYTTGWATSNTDFDPDTGVYYVPLLSNDIFIKKVGWCTTTSSYSYIDNGNGNYTFSNTSSGSFNQYHWAFGDGNTSNLQNPSHTFSTNGNFIVTLTINDPTIGASCFDYYLDTINVTGITNPLPCSSGFVIYPDTVTGDITVVNSSTGTNLTYLWNFGDGNTSTLQNPSHTYATAGPFYLCLTVDDGNGCIDMYCDSIGENGVVFKQTGFTINVIGTPIISGLDNHPEMNSDINIYPNPTSNQLSIDTELKISEITIIDITGKIIMTIKQNTNIINVADLSNGIYFIQLITEDRVITKKFVKQ